MMLEGKVTTIRGSYVSKYCAVLRACRCLVCHYALKYRVLPHIVYDEGIGAKIYVCHDASRAELPPYVGLTFRNTVQYYERVGASCAITL